MADKLECWHFANNDLRLGYDDGREIIAGETLRVECAPDLVAWWNGFQPVMFQPVMVR